MIRLYAVRAGHCVVTTDLPAEDLPGEGLAWIDLLHPTREEERRVEELLGVNVPTPEEMAEIETSSRLYREGDASFMTATLIMNADTEHPESTDVALVLTPRALVSVRYAEPIPFQTFAAHIGRTPDLCIDPESALVGLLDTIVDRVADVLEGTGLTLEELSHQIFAAGEGSRDFKAKLRVLGRSGDVISKARESLISLSRLVAFAAGIPQIAHHQDSLQGMKTVEQDIQALADHASFLSTKTTFLLDATLGMINIEQNAIIKIFSVVAVILLPPTLIASIYGMNFEHMPELGWTFGYPLALVGMVISMVISYLFFKGRGWL